MHRKLKLEVESLSVDTFETRPAPAGRPGTVHAREAACTCAASCACRTAPYYCAPSAYTYNSCDFTHNDSCTVQPTPVTCTADLCGMLQ